MSHMVLIMVTIRQVEVRAEFEEATLFVVLCLGGEQGTEVSCNGFCGVQSLAIRNAAHRTM